MRRLHIKRDRSVWLNGVPLPEGDTALLSRFGMAEEQALSKYPIVSPSLFTERDMREDNERRAVVQNARTIFDTLSDPYEEQLSAAKDYLESKQILYALTPAPFNDLLVPSPVQGHFDVVGFNLASQMELFNPDLPNPFFRADSSEPYSQFDDHQLRIIQQVIDADGSVSFGKGFMHLSGSFTGVQPFESMESSYIFFFHKGIWQFYPKGGPVEFLNILKWLIENINGVHISVYWDERNTAAAWLQALSKGTYKGLMNLSHGRILDGKSCIMMGNDKVGRPTEAFTADMLKGSINASIEWVVLYACHSLQTDTFATALLEAGVKSIVGWSEKTPAYPDFVDKVVSELITVSRASDQGFDQAIARMTQVKTLPAHIMNTEATLRVLGEASVKWWL